MGALAYTFQLYFDFSGYSDMALGIARMFGIVLPINFFSPYKSTSIVEFWRRWHITLSNFLRDYLYIPLGGNRHGSFRKYLNLMLTMLLGGMWHGAGWTFVIWGGLHGSYLVLNHAWRFLIGHYVALNTMAMCKTNTIKAFYWFLTFFAVVIAWVMFRSDSVMTAVNMYKAMLGFNGIYIANAFGNNILHADFMLLVYMIVWFYVVLRLPNAIEFLYSEQPALHIKQFKMMPNLQFWQPKPLLALAIALMAALTIAMLQKESEFLYFQF